MTTARTRLYSIDVMKANGQIFHGITAKQNSYAALHRCNEGQWSDTSEYYSKARLITHPSIAIMEASGQRFHTTAGL